MSPDRVVALWRYPVKSMQGEALGAATLARRGLLGDRSYAVVDAVDGRVASAKDTRRWPGLFAFRAFYGEPPRADGTPVSVALPDGHIVSSRDPSIDEVVSRALGRAGRLRGLGDVRTPGAAADEAEFFDAATVHLLTTSTLERLHELYPSGRFDVRRFRPNIVVDTGARPGFVENGWVGRTLSIGDGVVLEVTEPCPRCVMTTLPQADLPHDPGILRAAARHNDVNVGVYARVIRGGEVAVGDAVGVLAPRGLRTVAGERDRAPH